MFRPLLWSLKWDEIDAELHKDDIILAAVNEGRLAHWRWIKDFYGVPEIRRVLERRLETEVHPESRHLADVLFGVRRFRDAR